MIMREKADDKTTEMDKEDEEEQSREEKSRKQGGRKE